MRLSFELTMPGVASWNGRWSGEGRLYAKVVDFGRSQRGVERAKAILEQRSYGYHWSDGWSALVRVREVDGVESRRIKKASKGFCGYDWMIDSIRETGDIRVKERAS